MGPSGRLARRTPVVNIVGLKRVLNGETEQIVVCVVVVYFHFDDISGFFLIN